MFGAQKKSPPIRSLIGEGTVVQGDLTFTEGLRVDGEVHGNVTGPEDASSILIISDKAKVHGRVKAAHVIISGEVLGPIESTTLLELHTESQKLNTIAVTLFAYDQHCFASEVFATPSRLFVLGFCAG